jgi:hypothetical protein
MNPREYKQLLAEANALEQLLADIPYENVLERPGVEARLDHVKELLASAVPPSREPARARLTFRGRPVIEHRGIFVEFGTKATNAFTDVVAKFAAAISGPLASMGPVPRREESQLLITSTAFGSFGFELEEFRPPLLEFGDPSTSAQALEQTRSLLQSTLGSDDELADAASGTDPRALDAVRSFLRVLADNEAVCALELDEAEFRFSDVGEVRRSAERLSQDNLSEKDTLLMGEFQGVLPKARTFEFKLTANQEIVRGKIGPAISDPDDINRHLHSLVKINVQETRVGNGKPRYVLSASPIWPADTT